MTRSARAHADGRPANSPVCRSLRAVCVDTDHVTEERDYEPSAGAAYGFVGVAVIALGAISLANANENEMFGLLGFVFLASGCYATLAGAVARGIQLARQ